MLRVEDGRLIRARRIVVRVPRPPVAARLASSGDDNPHLAVSRSRLAEGRWFKVPIPETGIYRDRCGVPARRTRPRGHDPDVEHRHLRHRRAHPSSRQRVDRPADLLPVASLVTGDAVVFYAEGPMWWDWIERSGTRPGYWSHDISPFSTDSHYFLRLDDPSPTRIGDAAFPSWSDAEVLTDYPGPAILRGGLRQHPA